MKLDKPSPKDFIASLDNPVVETTRHLLLSGVQSHFPNVKPDTWTELRFFVYLKNYGSTTYVIVDDDLDLQLEIDLSALEIDLSALENPKFDLIKWYLDHAICDGRFYEKYLEQQLEYLPGCDASQMMESHPESSTSQTDMEELEVMRQMTSVLEHAHLTPVMTILLVHFPLTRDMGMVGPDSSWT